MNQLLAAGVCGLSNGSINCGSNLSLGAGQSIDANATNAVVLGTSASVVNPSNVTGAKAAGAIAIGNGAIANADPSVAIGNLANASGADAVAVGDSASATGNRVVALGYRATAAHDNAVALGSGSVTSAPNTVSVGSAGSERRIANVADPVDPQDAATKAYVHNLFGGGGTALQQANDYTNAQIAALRREAFCGIAQAAALVPLAPSGSGETTVNVGLASYSGESAGAVAVAHQAGMVDLNAGVGFANGSKSLVRVGLGWRF